MYASSCPRRLAWAVALLSMALEGCGQGDGLDRQAVSGQVTLDGKPVSTGLIQFLPASEDQPTATGGEIIDGQYEIGRDQGPVPGSYKVAISADSGKQPDMVGGMPGGAGTPNKELIPSKYNSQSTLTAEVKDGGPNEFPFELSSK